MTTKNAARYWIAAIALITACGGALVVQTPPHPQGFPNSTHNPPSPSLPAPSTFSGDLPKALDQMSGDELYNFIAAMPRGKGSIAERPCSKWNLGCFFSGGSVKVGIQAAADARWLNDNNADVDGTIAALAENKGKYRTIRYDLEPNDASEKHLYAFIVFRKGVTGGARYVLEEITTRGNVRTHRTVDAGRFIQCNHTTYWDESVAAFQTCAGKMSKSTIGSTGIVTMGFDLLALPKAILARVAADEYSLDDPPGWISCAAGCCTMGDALQN